MIFHYLCSSIKVIYLFLLQMIKYFYLLLDNKNNYFTLIAWTLFKIFIIKNLVLTYDLILFTYP
jgi:hypothetical protein